MVRNPEAVRRAIGLVSQKPSGDPMATGRENLVLAGRIQGLTRAAAGERAASLLDRFGLADAADRLTKTYSGGMARKLDVAIGLIHRPQVLFLDEPTTGLDPEARAEMWAEIERLSVDERTTVLLTTHYLDEADRLAERLAIVDHGRIVVEGTPEQLKSELRGDAVHVELASAASALAAQRALAGLAGIREVAADGDDAACPRGQRRARRTRRACGAGRRACRGRVGDRRAAVARRRLPAPCRSLVRGGSMSATDVVRPTPSSDASEGGQLDVVRHAGFLTMRSVRTLLRQPAYLLITLVQPVIWLLLFGQLFKSVVSIPGFTDRYGTYLEFITPGVIMMTALFSSGWAGTVYIEDMTIGVMDRLLASPVRRGAMMTATLAYQAITTLIQTLIVFGIAWVAGARWAGGWAGVGITLVCAVLIATVIAALSNAIALLVRQQEALIGISQFIVLPLQFLSSAVMDTDLSPGWVQHVARYNPVDWAVVASREALSAEHGLGCRPPPARLAGPARGGHGLARHPRLPHLPALRLTVREWCVIPRVVRYFAPLAGASHHSRDGASGGDGGRADQGFEFAHQRGRDADAEPVQAQHVRVRAGELQVHLGRAGVRRQDLLEAADHRRRAPGRLHGHDDRTAGCLGRCPGRSGRTR